MVPNAWRWKGHAAAATPNMLGVVDVERLACPLRGYLLSCCRGSTQESQTYLCLMRYMNVRRLRLPGAPQEQSMDIDKSSPEKIVIYLSPGAKGSNLEISTGCDELSLRAR